MARLLLSQLEAEPQEPDMADEKSKSEEAAPKAKKSPLLLILSAVIVLGGAGAAGWYFLLAPKAESTGEGEAHETGKHGDPLYFTLADNLVVNFRSPGGTRFLQVGIDLMTFDEDGLHALEKHAPVLRSGLILLLSDQSQETLLSREGKEALREEALAEIQHEMEELHGSAVVESLYFTSFVMQ
jgi:flagellar FliL protein